MRFEECRSCATLYSEETLMYKSNTCKYCHSNLYSSNYVRKTSFCDDIDYNEIKLYFQYVKNNDQNLKKFKKKLILLSKINSAYQEQFAKACNSYHNTPLTHNLPKCPTCGSANVHKISGVSKAASGALFGVFSLGYISKTFQCDNCGYQW